MWKIAGQLKSISGRKKARGCLVKVFVKNDKKFNIAWNALHNSKLIGKNKTFQMGAIIFLSIITNVLKTKTKLQQAKRRSC